ncbi:CapA family protein [Serpentinicella alkaliphila]|uniref:Poly-gamma-glutamate synthesis protein (Capsule biosynthesis protein) n=1 Tax=Serpentinicella alkaliphila TaxID=1734049 RepID=A0A4R2TBB6_9FIRM|nr:CapA family protein [Serpentinicella alkaliphila]QUH26092.1 CapA family protein [Serpentinicella alkaliphila]TCP99106.1 poly-gamma-glutamate synthesis protein (capsule biosynthesis protein) [Serpentinicella alkaliphila]
MKNLKILIPILCMLMISSFIIIGEGKRSLESYTNVLKKIEGTEIGKIEKLEIDEVLMDNQNEVELSVMLLGDVCLATNFGNRNRFHEVYDNKGPEYFFQYMQEYFNRVDYVIANIENVFTDRKEYQKGKIYTYKATTQYLEVIEKSGITHLAVVNNHMQDYLQAGFEDSIALLDKKGIAWFGTNEFTTSNIELGNIKVDKKEIIDKEGIRVGLLSYYGFNTSYATDETINRDVTYLKEIEDVDYIICYVHWGGQGEYTVTQRQKDYGRKLIDFGVDLVVGGHPHVVQKNEVYKGKTIFYSLGDFMFVAKNPQKDPHGLMVELKLVKDIDGNIKEKFEYYPVLWGGSEKTNHYTPKVGSQKDLNSIIDKAGLKK